MAVFSLSALLFTGGGIFAWTAWTGTEGAPQTPIPASESGWKTPNPPSAHEEAARLRAEARAAVLPQPDTKISGIAFPDAADQEFDEREKADGVAAGQDDFMPRAGAEGLRITVGKAGEDSAARALAAFTAGDFARARRLFSELAANDFAQDAARLDALLSLAALARREGDVEKAGEFYRAAYAAYPKRMRAQTEYIAFLGETGALAASVWEGRLSALVRAYPQEAAPRFALGNFYARQSRWQEAEAEFFAASALDASQPDVLFNLAVSLDALGKPAEAARQYRAALLAAEKTPFVFSAETARQRLAFLADTLNKNQ
jgi:tetratricopeptide (TPR) repeat protein